MPRVPRAGLSGDVVVDVAAALVDEAGADRLTLAAVAKRCGVALPSLYKHVDGLDDLHHRLAVRALTDLGDALRRSATGRAGGQAVRSLAAAYRDYARSHPGCYGYVLRARTGDAAHAAAAGEVLAVLYDVFAGYGLTDSVAVDAARFVRSTLHGFVSLELGGGFGMPESVDASFDRLVDAVDRALAAWPTESRRNGTREGHAS